MAITTITVISVARRTRITVIVARARFASAVGVRAIPLLISGPAPVAITAITVIIVARAAIITIVKIARGWRRRRRRRRRRVRWTWARTAGGDRNILEIQVVRVARAGLATVTPKPVVVGAPV